MFIRNGEALGSVLHSAVPGVKPKPAKITAAAVAYGGYVDVSQQDLEPSVLEVAVDDLAASYAAETTSTDPPKTYDPKADWIDYAVAQGAQREEAEGLTKAELIEMYGG